MRMLYTKKQTGGIIIGFAGGSGGTDDNLAFG